MTFRYKFRFAVATGALVLLAVVVYAWRVVTPPAPAVLAPHMHSVRTLRLGLNIAAGSALHAAAMRFASQVEAHSKGKIKVVVYPNQQLGNDDQMLEMARSGKLDLVLTPTAKLSSAIPAMQYADLPFYFSGREELYAMLDGEPGRMLLSRLNAIDLTGLAFWENGFKQFTANTPIRVPDDFARLRIRTMKSRIIVEQFESLGAKAIPIDFHATYKALADGAVDGQENPLVAIVGMRFYEVQKHLTMSNHAYLGYVFSASKRAFETLPPDLRDIIQRSAQELTVWEREETARREAGFLDTIRAAGMTVYPLSAAERQCFSAALAHVADKFGFEVGYDLLAKTEELRYAKQAAVPAYGSRSPWLIGLDADLSGSGAQAGGAIYRGMQLAVEEINQKGGLLGTPLSIIALNHGGNSHIGRENIRRLAAMPSVLAVVGGMHTPVVMEELEDIHRLRVPFLIPWAAGQSLTAHDYRPSYVFRVSISDKESTPFLLERARKSGGRVAILLEQTAWGRSSEAALKPLLDKLPPGSVEINRIYAGDAHIEGKITALVRGGTRALLMVTDVPVARSIVQAMAHQEKPVPIFSQWALTGSDFWQQEQAALRRVDLRFVQSILMDELQVHPNLGKFLGRYRKRYGLGPDDVIPSPDGSAQAYDLIHLLAQAVTQAESGDRKLIRAALENLRPYSGVMRDYNPPFTQERHEALHGQKLHLGRFDARGRIVLAE